MSSREGHSATPSASLPELKGFRILLELARSPKGVIYKARRLVEQDVVALKVFRPSLCERKFVQELPANAEASFLLEHRHLVRTLGCVHDSGSLLLMTDYAQGDPASKILARERPLQPSKALRIALQCANALSYAASHKRFHGRMHPGDIILGEDDAQIIGIGLGERPEHAAWAVRDPYLFEPLAYTAPEFMPSHAVVGSPEAMAAADIYSLGAILFHLLTGTPPFRERDEEAIVNERKGRLVSPVVWPSEVKGKLPMGAAGLVEKMMATDPALRPTYDEIVGGLTRILESAERDELLKSQSSAAALAAANETITSTFRSGLRDVSAPPPPQPVARPQVIMQSPHVQQQAQRAVDRQTSRMLTRLYTMFLVGMTALAFIVVFGFLGIIFFYGPSKLGGSDSRGPVAVNTHGPIAPTDLTQRTQPQTAPKELPPPISPPLGVTDPKTDEYATATRQLDYIQEMLGKNEIKHTPALLRLTRSIAERAGKDTSTGVRSMVLAAEIEESLLRQGRNEARDPFEKPVLDPNQIPGVGKTGAAPIPEKTETPAKVAVEVPISVPAPQQPPAEKPPVAEKTPPAQPAQPAPGVAAPARLDEKITTGMRDILGQAKAFQYKEMSSALDKLSNSADGDAKKFIDAFASASRAEAELFKRCRQRLGEQIQRHPRHDSPLQVFPRKNDPNGDDITDFDEKGLTIATKKGNSVTKTNKDWAKIPPLQAYMLLQLLADRNSADDQCGLAIFAFSRGLKDESLASLETARGAEGGKEKADALQDLLKSVTNAIETAK